jgi:hypothetical protein
MRRSPLPWRRVKTWPRLARKPTKRLQRPTPTNQPTSNARATASQLVLFITNPEHEGVFRAIKETRLIKKEIWKEIKLLPASFIFFFSSTE